MEPNYKNHRTAHDQIRVRQSLGFYDEDGNQALGLTKQAHKDECDVNRILQGYDRTGLITHVNHAQSMYGDYTEVNEYQENMLMVIQAQESFAALPSEIRKHFSNDPGEFFEFVTDPKNSEEMIKLGLATAKLPPERIPPSPSDTDSDVNESTD